MYEIIIKLIDGEILDFKNVYCSHEIVKSELDNLNNFFIIDDFCIKKSEIKYIECRLKSEVDE